VKPAMLFAELQQLGLKVAAEGGQLRVRGPRRVLTPELTARLADAKAALLELLGAPNSCCDDSAGDAASRPEELLREWANAQGWPLFRPLGGLPVGPGRDEWERWLTLWTPAQVNYVLMETQRACAYHSDESGKSVRQDV
jgi:hypothetical protein